MVLFLLKIIFYIMSNLFQIIMVKIIKAHTKIDIVYFLLQSYNFIKFLRFYLNRQFNLFHDFLILQFLDLNSSAISSHITRNVKNKNIKYLAKKYVGVIPPYSLY